MKSAYLLINCFLAFNGTDVSLKLASGAHNLMSTAEATKFKIHSGTENNPTLLSARVFFFHG